MNHIGKRAALCGAALLACAAASATPAAAKTHRPKLITLSGTVVHENNSAHSFVVAERSGRLDAVHGRQLPVGEKVRVTVSRLANGTFAARRERVLARSSRHRMKIGGVVTADDPATHEVVVSSSGTSIPVDTSDATGDAAPAVGEGVGAEVEVEPDGSLKGEAVTDTGQSDSFRVEGKVLSVDPQASTLTISGDDDDETGQQVTVALPSGFDITAFSVGDCVELVVARAADGTLTAVQAFGDNGRGDANRRGRGRDRGDSTQPQPEQQQSGGSDDEQPAQNGGSGERSGADSASGDQSGRDSHDG
jgi:hypothetical protein